MCGPSSTDTHPVLLKPGCETGFKRVKVRQRNGFKVFVLFWVCCEHPVRENRSGLIHVRWMRAVLLGSEPVLLLLLLFHHHQHHPKPLALFPGLSQNSHKFLSCRNPTAPPAISSTYRLVCGAGQGCPESPVLFCRAAKKRNTWSRRAAPRDKLQDVDITFVMWNENPGRMLALNVSTEPQICWNLLMLRLTSQRQI